jgi:hypothetical protein
LPSLYDSPIIGIILGSKFVREDVIGGFTNDFFRFCDSDSLVMGNIADQKTPIGIFDEDVIWYVVNQGT